MKRRPDGSPEADGLVLVVIDMLVDFFDRSPALARQRAALVASINDLAARFRSAGRPVIWVRQAFRADLSDAFLDMREHRISITIEGTQGSRVLPELEVAADESLQLGAEHCNRGRQATREGQLPPEAFSAA